MKRSKHVLPTRAETQRLLNDRYAQASTKRIQLSADSSKATQRQKQTQLTSPVDGTVQQLAIHSVGGVVILLGGQGTDTYIYQTAGGADTIVDSDGAGRIQFDGQVLSGGIRAHGSNGAYTSRNGLYSFVVAGGDLTVNGSITVKGFKNKDLGIYLDETDDPQDPLNPLVYNPNNASVTRRWDPLALDMDGNGQIDTISSPQSGIYFDFNGDAISERAGWVAAQDGLLALDANGNGAIDGLNELFGSGISQASELQTLASAGITAINCFATKSIAYCAYSIRARNRLRRRAGNINTQKMTGRRAGQVMHRSGLKGVHA